MDTAAAIGAGIGLAGGIAAGFVLGRRFRAHCRRGAFWVASGGSIVLGVIVVLLGEIAGLTFIAGAGVGLVTGGVNGLRWGMGRLGDETPEKQASAAACESDRAPREKDHTPHPAT